MEAGIPPLSPGNGIQVHPGFPLHGELPQTGEAALPGDKSLSHRAALLAAMAEGVSRVENFLVAGVTRAMLSGLRALGVDYELDGVALRVQGCGLTAKSVRRSTSGVGVHIDCGNSATTLRLLAGGLAAWNQPAVLDGSSGLRRRPMERIVAPLRQMGVDVESSAGCAPLTLKPSPRPLNAIDYTLPVASAQVKSCLLLAALAAGGPSLLREPGPSRDHTERMLRRLGVEVRSEAVDLNGSFGDQGSVAYVTHLIPPDPLRLKPFEVHLPGDFSAAAFLIVAALVTPGSEITLREVGLNPTRTGLLEALGGMGAEIQIINQMERDGEPVGDLLVRHSRLQGGRVAGDLVVRMIDEFPAFAVAAACAGGRTEVAQAGELRHKESDRIASLAGELRKLGVPVSETPDGFAIQGGTGIRGGLVEAHGDHRLGMALVVAGLAAQEPVTVQGTSIIAESFPGFLQALSSLGAKLTPPG